MRLIFMDVTTAWAIHPEGSLPGTAKQVWELIVTSLEPQGSRHHGSRRAPNLDAERGPGWQS